MILFYGADEETESLYLVDFTQKIIEQKRAAGSGDRDGEGSDLHVPIPPPQSTDEEWYSLRPASFIYLFVKRGIKED